MKYLQTQQSNQAVLLSAWSTFKYYKVENWQLESSPHFWDRAILRFQPRHDFLTYFMLQTLYLDGPAYRE